MLLRKLPHKGPRHRFVLQEPTVGQDRHTLLTPREHHVRSPHVLHEPGRRRSDDRNHDVVFLISLERVNVEHRVCPIETRRLERVLDRVSLCVVRGDNLEVLALLDVPIRDMYCGPDFALVLRKTRIFSVSDGFVLRRVVRTTQLTPFLASFPSITSTKRQQIWV